MSLAVFTDSTTAHASPAFTFRPTCGSSTNTTSVNSCCAWSVIPTVASVPDTRTHSCDLAYFKSFGTFAINLKVLSFRQVASAPSIRFSVDRLRHHECRRTRAADFDLKRRLGFRELRWNVSEANTRAERWALGAAHGLPHASGLRSRAPNRVTRTWRRRSPGHLECRQLPSRSVRLLPRQHFAAREVAFLERDKESES